MGVAVDVELPGIVHPDGARDLALDLLDVVLGEEFGRIGTTQGGGATLWPHAWRLLYATPRGPTDVVTTVDTLAAPPRPHGTRDLPSWPGRGRPWFPVPRARWVPTVVRTWCMHAVLRAIVSTLAAENTLRSVAMERAERHAEELLEAMRATVRRNRIEQVDDELRDAGSWRWRAPS